MYLRLNDRSHTASILEILKVRLSAGSHRTSSHHTHKHLRSPTSIFAQIKIAQTLTLARGESWDMGEGVHFADQLVIDVYSDFLG